MNLFQIRKYIDYTLFSRHSGGHGIHSPFIFEIVSGLFRNKIPEDVVCCIEAIRRNLEKDRRDIVVNDLGSGSAGNKKHRKVAEIARKSAITKKYGVLLYNLASRFGESPVIELGTSFGISTMYLASACRVVYSVEGCKECAEIAENSFAQGGLINISLINSPFEDAISDMKTRGIRPGLVFIDGDHREEPLLKNFRELVTISDENTVFVLDDIYYSPGMAHAWEQIRNMDNVTATIDIFRMGIVFFRKEITCNHYKIRY